MTGEEIARLRRVEAAFHEAVSWREGAERENFLATARVTDPDIFEEVQQLIASYSQIGGAGPAFSEVREELPRFGAWQALRIVGSGGMGTVYLAERADGAFEIQAAVKVVPLALASSEIYERFRRERQVLAMLDHRGIARLIDGGVSQNGLPFLVMEFVDGESIDRYAARLGLDVRARVALILQVLDALKYIHSQRVLHRDLKPSNVLVDGSGRVRVVDFGIARLMEGAPGDALTRSRFVAFTPDYASPEQQRGDRLTESSDIYSAGVLLAKLVSPKPPVAKRAGGDQLEPDLAAVVSKAVSRDVSGRYRSAEEMAADLERYLTGRHTAALTSRRRMHILLAAVGCILLAAIAWVYIRRPAVAQDVVLAERFEIVSPTFTPDGRWAAYVIQNHIWLRELGKQPAHEVTFGAGRELHPALSPDGRTLVYEHRDDGSQPAAFLYRLRLDQGRPVSKEERLLPGYKPKISPDGNNVAFETAHVSGADETTLRGIRIAPLFGVGSSAVEVRQPAVLADWIWMANSQSLLAVGRKSAQTSGGPNREQFFELRADGSAPNALKFWPSEYGVPVLCGLRNGQAAAVATSGSDQQWVEMDPNGDRLNINRRHLPAIAGCEILADGRLAVFADSRYGKIWEIRGDTANGSFANQAARPTGLNGDSFLSASVDGRWLAWGDHDKDLLRDPRGKSIQLYWYQSGSSFSPISPDGSAIALKDRDFESRYRILSLPGLQPVRSFEVESVLWDLSKEGRLALCIGTPEVPRTIAVLDTATGMVRTFLQDPVRDLYLASFSPDQKWILFTAEAPHSESTIYVARFDPSRVIPPAEWIEIERGDYPKWGMTTDRIYHLAPRGREIVTIALSPTTKRPLPESRKVVFSFSEEWGLGGLRPGSFRIGVTQDRLLFLLGKHDVSVSLLGRRDAAL